MLDGTSTTLECPRDEGTTLVAVDRNGVTVDACPRCRGVWLDRGELDKLIELEAAASEDFRNEIGGGSRARDGGHGGYSGHGSKKRKKRGSFLGEMLDFG